MLAKLSTAELLTIDETERAAPVIVFTQGKDAAVYSGTKTLPRKKKS